MHYLDGYITAYSYFCLFVDVTSTNSISYNGELTYEHVCSLPTFVNILQGRFTTHSYSSNALMGTFEADYVNHNNHRKHTNRSNNRVYIQTRVLGRVRNDSDGFSVRGSRVLSGLIYRGKMLYTNQVVLLP